MLAIGWHSDRRRERLPYLLASMTVVASSFVLLTVASAPAVVVFACCAAYTGFFGIQASFWLVPTDLRHGRDAAIGVAAIGSMGMLGAFSGPLLWGRLVDATGGFRTGQAATVALLVIAGAILLTLRRSEERPTAVIGEAKAATTSA
jgi:ACS family tartrate transporter-like MFS transporter